MRKNILKDPEVIWLKQTKGTMGWSYSRLAQELKITKETVFSWFRGETRPSPLARMRIRALRKRLGSLEKIQPPKKSSPRDIKGGKDEKNY
jgi:transcriptional regulator with XRE-family HTH domain